MAANLVNTAVDGEKADDFDFNKWVEVNNLNVIKHLLIKHEMTTINTLNITSKQYQNLMSDPQILPFCTKNNIIPTIFAALNNVPKIIEENEAKIIIIMSESEEDAIKKLDQFNENNKIILSKLNNKKDEIIKNNKICESKIESSFNYLLSKIAEKQDEIKKKLKNLEKEKISNINEKSIKINKQQTNIKNAQKKCKELIINNDINSKQRKKEIISICNDATKEKISKNITNISTAIHFQFNKDNISSFLSNLCDIFPAHPLPIIDGIECESIGCTEATLKWNASLSSKEDEMEEKVATKLMMKLECLNDDIDEKEKENINGSDIEFNTNCNQYQYKIKSLQKNKKYKFNINLYESMDAQNAQNTKRTDWNPINIEFKTKLYDKIDKHFIYQSDFDENGILYELGTNHGKEAWENPAGKGLINITSSGWCGGHLPIKCVVDRRGTGYCFTKNLPNSWIMIDFKEKLKIKPTKYTLRHEAHGTNTCCLRNWNLEGSNDGNTWNVIKQHINDTSIQHQYQAHSWDIGNCQDSYRMFRIYGTGKNSSNYDYIMCNGFEIYGHLTGTK